MLRAKVTMGDAMTLNVMKRSVIRVAYAFLKETIVGTSPHKKSHKLILKRKL